MKNRVFINKIQQRYVGKSEDLKFDDYEYILDGATSYERIAIFDYKDDAVRKSRVIDSGNYLITCPDDAISASSVGIGEFELDIYIQDIEIHDKNGKSLFEISGLQFAYYGSGVVTDNRNTYKFELSSIEHVEIHTDDHIMIDPTAILEFIVKKINEETEEERTTNNIEELKSSQEMKIKFLSFLVEKQRVTFGPVLFFFFYEEELNFVKKGEVLIKFIDHDFLIKEYDVKSEHCHEIDLGNSHKHLNINYITAKYRMLKINEDILDFFKFKVIDVFKMNSLEFADHKFALSKNIKHQNP